MHPRGRKASLTLDYETMSFQERVETVAADAPNSLQRVNTSDHADLSLKARTARSPVQVRADFLQASYGVFVEGFRIRLNLAGLLVYFVHGG